MYSIKELLDGYEKKKFSPTEITKQYLERAKKNQNLNAMITITEELAMQQAKISEQKWQMKNPGFLEGIPLTYKDNFYTKGIPSTSGSKIDQNFIPDQNASLIEIMNQKGGIMIGKNNMHEFAFGITSNNPFYGPVKNPWNEKLTPGGSSGGSGVAVLTGMSIASLGTDTGGSVRIPAASCGLVGLKPTHGLLSQQGITPLSWTLDHPGPITNDISDLILMMEGLTGNDYSIIDSNMEDLRGVKVGVPVSFFNEQIEPEVLEAYKKTLKKFEQLGAHLVDVKMPLTDEATPLTFTLATAEGGFTHRDRMQHMDDYGEDVRQIMEASKSISSMDYLHALDRRDAVKAACSDVLEQVDVVIVPTTPAQPKPIGQETVHFNSIEEPIFDCMIRYASYFNLTGHPAISLPVGLANGLPVSVQLISGKWKERNLISISKVFENYYLDSFYEARQDIINKYI